VVRVVLFLVNTCPQAGGAEEIILDASLCFGWRPSGFSTKYNSLTETPAIPTDQQFQSTAYPGLAKHLKISTLS